MSPKIRRPINSWDVVVSPGLVWVYLSVGIMKAAISGFSLYMLAPTEIFVLPQNVTIFAKTT